LFTTCRDETEIAYTEWLGGEAAGTNTLALAVGMNEYFYLGCQLAAVHPLIVVAIWCKKHGVITAVS